MAGTYWLTILPDTSKLKPAINAAMRGEKITADFGIDEAKARKAGRDAAKLAEAEAEKAGGAKVKATADRASASKAGADAGHAVSQAFDKTADGDKVGRQFGGRMAGGLKATLGSIGPMIAGLGLAGGLSSALTAGIDFTTQLNTMKAVSDATGDELARVSELARQLGNDISLPGVSAGDAARAMTELAKGGLSASEAMGAVRGTLQLAGAASVDAATAATIQADALSAFQLQAADAGRVADLLAGAANASTSEVTDIAQALGQSGTAAAGFGISIEDTLTSLAMFSNFGIKGSDAGTLMKSSLLAITDGGKPAQAAIKALGLELYNAQGQFVGYPQMLEQVAAASTRMTDEQFQAATATLFGSDAMRASMVAAKGGAAGFNEIRDAVTRQGIAAEVAAAKAQGLPGAWANFQNTVDSVKMRVYDLVDGPLESLLNKLSGIPAFVERNSTVFKVLAGIITTLLIPALTMWTIAQAKAIGTSIVGAVTGLIGSWTAMAGAISSAAAAAATYAITIARGVAASIVAGITSMVAAFRSLAIGTRIAAAAQAAFNLVLNANPIGLIVTAIAAVVAGLVYFFTKTELGQKIWKKFTDYLLGAWDSIKSAFATAWDFIGNIWDSMVTKADEVWQGIKDKFTAVVDFVKGLPSRIGDAAKGMWDGISNAFKGMIDKLKGWWNGFASKLSWTSPEWLPGDPVTFSLPTFSRGGYTGNAGVNDIAGIVHGGEYVIKASSRERLESALPGLLDYLNKTGRLPGYYKGGRVALGNISGPGITTAEQQSMWDAIRSAFPDAVLSSATRTVMTEGHPDLHNAGRAIDLTGPNMGAMAAWIAQNYPNSLELIHSPFNQNIKNGKNVGNGMDFYGAGQMAAHENHVHWALGSTADMPMTAEESANSSAWSVGAAASSSASSSSGGGGGSSLGGGASSTGRSGSGGGSSTGSGSGKPNNPGDAGQQFGQMFVSGLMESIGLDGSLFSNPLEWPSIKSLMAGINWAGGLLSIAGATPESMGAASGGGTAGGFAAGAADAVGLGGLLSAIPSATEMATRSGSPALSPGEFNPAVAGGTSVAATAGMSTFAPAPHGGTGGAPGPAVDNSININGNVGMDPAALQTKIRTEQNARTRSTVVR